MRYGSRLDRLWVSYGWILAFVPLLAGLLVAWLIGLR